jgi:histidyl-tRNA synthetase
VWCVTPAFRYERPQAGRLRQHHQVDVEVFGVADPDADVEVMALGASYLQRLGLQRWRLAINSMGTPEDRLTYVDRLRSWLAPRIADLDAEDRDKIETHPLRVLDSKRPATQAVVADAPRLLDSLDPDSQAQFDRVQQGLKALGIAFEIDTRLVRGLDYYTHTLFEFQSLALDTAQSTIIGGGRYDGLVEQLGGPPTPATGFGSGIERMLLACAAEDADLIGDAAPLDVFVVDTTGGAEARDLSHQLRGAGLRVDRAFDSRSMKAQMKAAGRSGARVAVIVGEQEQSDGTVVVRDLAQGEQQSVPRGDLIAHLHDLMEDA